MRLLRPDELGAEAAMLTLGDSCKHRASVVEGFECTRTVVNDCLQPHIKTLSSEWQVTIKLHLVAGFKSKSHT